MPTAVSDIYLLRGILFRGKPVTIVLQNENGPCPFIAICNVLFLRQYIALPSDAASVTLAELLNITTDYLFEKRGSSQSADMQYQLDDVVRSLPSLQEGMDINVRFQSVDAYEFMPAMVCFDAFNIQMVHGWVVDAGHPEFAEVVGKSSYNGLTDLLIARNEILDQREKRAAAEQAQKDKAEKPAEEGAVAAEAGEPTTAEPKPEPEDPRKRLEDDKVVRKAAVAAQFLDQTAGQLTYTGLIELNKRIQEGELCVLFRNNHFSTLTKYQNRLFCLLTDVGYADVPEAVWELLAEIDGDMHIVNSQFLVPRDFGRQGNVMNAAAERQHPPREQPAYQPQQQAQHPHRPEPSRQQVEQSDAELAQRLQLEEQQLERERQEQIQRRRLQQQQQQQQQNAQQPPRQPPRQPQPRPQPRPQPPAQRPPAKKQKEGGCCTQ